MRVMAGIVLYNPEIKRLKENLEAVFNQVEEIVLIDNNSVNIEEIQDFIKQYTKCKVIRNKKNEGIARALNQILEYAIEQHYEWFLTLDQDSVCYPSLIECYERYIDIKNIGIITSFAVDRNIDNMDEFLWNEESSYVTYCITSGALMNTHACIKCSGWDDRLFIDNVDGEICIHMKLLGYKVLSIKRAGILHEVGHGRNVRFLWKKENVSNHPASRQYYMARNHIYVARKYPTEFKIYKELRKELHHYRMIIMYEEDKLKKIKARIRGVRDGFKIRCNPVE